jgi:hypothetical protein
MASMKGEPVPEFGAEPTEPARPRVSDEQIEDALADFAHVPDGAGGSAGSPGYLDLARDLRDARAERDALRRERDKAPETGAQLALAVEQLEDWKKAHDIIAERYMAVLRRAEALEKERLDAKLAVISLMAQVAALREALDVLHGNLNHCFNPGTGCLCDTGRVLADTEAAARAHDSRVRREALEGMAARLTSDEYDIAHFASTKWSAVQLCEHLVRLLGEAKP